MHSSITILTIPSINEKFAKTETIKRLLEKKRLSNFFTEVFRFEKMNGNVNILVWQYKTRGDISMVIIHPNNIFFVFYKKKFFISIKSLLL